MAFFEDLSRKVQDVAFAAAEKGKEVAAIASEKAQDAADTVKTNVAIAGEQRAIEKNYRAIGGRRHRRRHPRQPGEDRRAAGRGRARRGRMCRRHRGRSRRSAGRGAR